MAPPLFSLRHVTLSFGGKPLFKDLSLNVRPGDKICLVGRNGSGKSTLFKLIQQQLEIDSGEFYVEPGLRIGYMPQDEVFPEDILINDYLQQQTQTPQYEVDAIAMTLGIDLSRTAAGLSGGERRRISLAKLLLQNPDVMLLDEPTNHLDIPTIQWLEATLNAYRGAYLVISHDRAFLTATSRRTFWLDRGRLLTHNKGYADYERWSEFVVEEEKRRIAQLDVHLQQELHWLHRGVTARRTRNQGRLRKLQQLREHRQSIRMNQHGKVKLNALDPTFSSKMILEVENIHKAYDENVLIDDFSLRILRGDRIGIMGANGTGKTTLLKILTGEIAPDHGYVRRGTTLDIIYFDQMRDHLKSHETLWQTLCETGGDHVTVQGRSRHVMAYLKDFMFDESQVRGPVSLLSGGERNRLALAKALTQPGNVLVLDEPTNDLDMETLDLLHEMLSDFEGTLIIVSHDRDFLDKLTTSLVVFEGAGKVHEYIGGYQDYLRQRRPDASASRKERSHKSEKPVQKRTDSPAPSTQMQKPQRLSYHEQRLYELLPQEIEEHQKTIAELETQLASPTLYQEDPEYFQSITARLEKLQKQVEDKEEQWLGLAERVEQFTKNRSFKK